MKREHSRGVAEAVVEAADGGTLFLDESQTGSLAA